GRWQGETLSLATLDVRMSDASIQAAGDVQPRAKSGSGHASVDAPGLQLRIDGKIAEHSGGGKADVRATDLAQALKWLARWPGVPDSVGAQVASGHANAQMAWQGGWDDPAVQARIDAPQLTLKGDPAWNVRDALLTVNGRLADAQVQLHAKAEQDSRRVDFDAAGR